MIIDKLYKNVEEKGLVCLGLDTAFDYIPNWFKEKYNNVEDTVFNFNKSIIDSTIDVVACYKLQIAYYEALGISGLNAYKNTLKYIKSLNAFAIGDIKRGDIKDTAKMYAKAHFEGDFECDMITLSPYMGMDSLEPYLPYVEKNEKGLFVLVRTSNPGSKDIQYIVDENKRSVYDIVSEKLWEIASKYVGESKYSSIGGVVGSTNASETIEMRNKYNNMFFLIPGYGAQGGGKDDVIPYLKNGNGAIVNSSRGILLAYKKHEDGETKFNEYARMEAIRMRDELRTIKNGL